MTHKERAKEVRRIMAMTPDEVIKAAKGQLVVFDALDERLSLEGLALEEMVYGKDLRRRKRQRHGLRGFVDDRRLGLREVIARLDGVDRLAHRVCRDGRADVHDLPDDLARCKFSDRGVLAHDGRCE